MTKKKNTGGEQPPSESTKSNVVDLAQFRKNQSISQPIQQQSGSVELINPELKPKYDPVAQTWSLSTIDGDVTVEGAIGLTPNFLAFGDSYGNIKFAAAAGNWKYVANITEQIASEQDLTETLNSGPEVA